MAAPSSIAFKCDIQSNTMHSGPRVLHKYIVLTICHVHFCIAALSSNAKVKCIHYELNDIAHSMPYMYVGTETLFKHWPSSIDPQYNYEVICHTLVQFWTLRPEQKGRRFAGHICKWKFIFVLHILQYFFPKDSVDKTPFLVQLMTLCR